MNTQSGEKLLSAVENLLAPDHVILAEVAGHRADAGGDRDPTCRKLVRAYSNRSAIAGAAAAAPALLPVAGPMAVATLTLGTTLLEMAYLLKLESEMCLALCSAYEFDIRLPEHRQIALLLAAVGTHEVLVDRNPLIDVGEVTMQAVLTYTPRELSKSLLKVLTAVAAVYAGRTVAQRVGRMLPVIGVGIGAGVNKVLTARVGNAARAALAARLAAVTPLTMTRTA